MKQHIFYCDGSPREGLNAFAVLTQGVQAYVCYDNPVSVGVIEYRAVLFALEHASGGDKIYTDSQFIVRQLTGVYKTKAKHLISLNKKAKKLMKTKNITVEWIPREKNPAGKYLAKVLKERKELDIKL